MLLLIVAGSLAAAFTARINLQEQGYGLTGALNCTPGGAVTGQVQLALPATDQSGPQLQAGGRAAGRYDVQVQFTGSFTNAAPDALQGTASLTGTFTDAGGQIANVSGTGTFTGSGSEALGTVSVEASWPQLQCLGAGLTNPQEFTLRLPPLTIDNTATPATGVQTPVDDTTVTGGQVQPGPPAGRPLADPGTTPPATPVGVTVTQPLDDPPTTAPTVLQPRPPATTGTTTDTPPPTPTGAGGTLETAAIKAILGERLEADRRGVLASATLSAQCSLVYLYLQAKQTPAQAMLHVSLYQDGKLKQRNLLPAQGGDEFVVTFYATDAEAFPPGSWSVVIKAGEQELGTIPFTVATP
ncbi:MAG: hypothetical protein KKI08_00715 [Armatimonadetes bacterium]|nr:hypothetical protein [Armatimonadota bacterium]